MQTRFRGLSIPQSDRQNLEEMSRRSNLPAWQYKRCRALLMLSDGARITHVREKIGCADHNIRRWVRTYQRDGFDAAFERKHGGGVGKKLSPSEEQRVVALACSDPPEGQARWSVRLLAEHCERVLDGKRIRREKVRMILKANDLKPWREKNVVRTEARRRIPRAYERSAQPVRATLQRV